MTTYIATNWFRLSLAFAIVLFLVGAPDTRGNLLPIDYVYGTGTQGYFLNAANPVLAQDNTLSVSAPVTMQESYIVANGQTDIQTTKKYRPRSAAPGVSMTVVATAYSSTVDQTDSSPFIAADGTHVYDGMIAANFLPFKTKVKIPDLYGDKIFTVHDRMNRRYDERVDIWFSSREAAKQFGKRTIRIEVL